VCVLRAVCVTQGNHSRIIFRLPERREERGDRTVERAIKAGFSVDERFAATLSDIPLDFEREWRSRSPLLRRDYTYRIQSAEMIMTALSAATKARRFTVCRENGRADADKYARINIVNVSSASSRDLSRACASFRILSFIARPRRYN